MVLCWWHGASLPSHNHVHECHRVLLNLSVQSGLLRLQGSHELLKERWVLEHALSQLSELGILGKCCHARVHRLLVTVSIIAVIEAAKATSCCLLLNGCQLLGIKLQKFESNVGITLSNLQALDDLLPIPA